MKHMIMFFAWGWLCLFFATIVQGQQVEERFAAVPPPEVDVSLADVQPTPEMWFYVQERRRYDDPRAAVRRKAEFRARQRQQRIAAMKLFGESKQRPQVDDTVFSSFFTTKNDYGRPVIRPAQVIEIYHPRRPPYDSGSP